MANNNYTAIPSELTTLPQWVLWDRRNKAPLTIRGANASVTNPHTWATFEQAVTAFEQAKGPVGGIGFVLTPDDPYCVIDLDHCVDHPEMQGWAADIRDEMQSYSEYSPSGTGLHIWIKAKLPGTRRRTGSFEIYDSERYLTVTGNPVGGECGFSRIESRQQEVNALCQRMFRAEEASISVSASIEIDGLNLKADAYPPMEKLAIMLEWVSGFEAIWNRQCERGTNWTPSQCDLAIASQCAREGAFTDQEIANTIIYHRRRHHQDVGKAMRKDYIERTISKARGDY